MFRKVLIANRGEIAVRIIRACRELGSATLALYQTPDRGSLHVRLADECVQLDAPNGFLDGQVVLRIALEKGADAIHPGYGFLAERADFVQACNRENITLIGPPAEVVAAVGDKIQVLRRVHAAGIPTPAHSNRSFGAGELEAIQEEASQLGLPVVVKSTRGGRGRGERLIWSMEKLEQTVRRALAESLVVYGERRIYLEKALLPAHQIAVQILGDAHGKLAHLGEREGSTIIGNQKMIEESPAPSLNPSLRENLFQAALEIGRLFQFQGVGTVEFLVDETGNYYFTEIKPRIQIDHPLTEMVTRVDLVREQMRLSAGYPLSLPEYRNDAFSSASSGWAMLCRIRAVDPQKQFMPSPGRLEALRLPGGADVRVDTYLYPGCQVPAEYDPLIAKLVVWGDSRQSCLERLRGALQEFLIVGVATNLSLLQQIVEDEAFSRGVYHTGILTHAPAFLEGGESERLAQRYRDLAAIIAVRYLQQKQRFSPTSPARLASGWHRASRRLPE